MLKRTMNNYTYLHIEEKRAKTIFIQHAASFISDHANQFVSMYDNHVSWISYHTNDNFITAF